jgi:predicted nucleic acid-binding protein
MEIEKGIGHRVLGDLAVEGETVVAETGVEGYDGNAAFVEGMHAVEGLAGDINPVVEGLDERVEAGEASFVAIAVDDPVDTTLVPLPAPFGIRPAAGL